MAAFSPKEIKERIQALSSMKDLDPSEFCEEGGLAASFAEQFRDKLKPAQLRKVFHALKAIRREVERQPKEAEFSRTRIVTLMPTLAYASGRGVIPKEFYDLMKVCLGQEKLKTNEDFLRLDDFVTAILSYHKFYS